MSCLVNFVSSKLVNFSNTVQAHGPFWNKELSSTTSKVANFVKECFKYMLDYLVVSPIQFGVHCIQRLVGSKAPSALKALDQASASNPTDPLKALADTAETAAATSAAAK